MTTFFRLLSDNDKSTALATLVQDAGAQNHAPRIFEVQPESLAKIPGTPFAYWISENLRRLFMDLTPFESCGRIVRQGGVTGNDSRFLRLWFEIQPGESNRLNWRWILFAKGGALSSWYSEFISIVLWDQSRSTFAGYTGLLHRPSEKPSSAEHYFKPGLTWPLRASRFAPVPLPRDSIFSIRGYAILAAESELLIAEALGNSVVFDYLFKVALGRFGFPEFVVGVLQKLPFPEIDAHHGDKLSQLARRAWSLKRDLDTVTQSSHAFIMPAVVQVSGASFSECAEKWSRRVQDTDIALGRIQAETDDLAFQLYDIDAADRSAIESRASSTDDAADGAADADDAEPEAEEREEEEEAAAGVASLAMALVSWVVGVAMGRFDVRLATGESPRSPEPDPFDPLPPCSPGMLTGKGGLPIEAPPPGYPIAFPRDGILVDDPGDRTDITGRVRAIFDCVFGAEADGFWAEAAQILGNGEGDLRRWLSRGLFEDTIRRYSKSRRKAPIYWQLATPSANYSVWLYYHRLTKDTFYTVLSDHLDPKLQHEERRLGALLADGGDSPDARQRRQIAEQETFVEELRAFREETARIAPLWSPNHDDGVIINFAPLWRLVPQHRAWQRECKACWDKLVAGDYDWSHLAMHLWPERVVPKCADDRSVSIAHGLEDRLWVEDLDGRWRQRQSIDGTVRYLEQQLLSKALTQTIRELEAFSKEHGTRHAGPGKTWWEALSGGDHDDHPLALALWPERVLSNARGSRHQKPRHDQAELMMVASFCDHIGSLSEWSERWAALHAGDLDEEPIARFLYPWRVVERAQQDSDFAANHDLARWFWLDESGGSRRLMEPEQELAAAVKDRESAAVKAALKSLLEAPAPDGGSRRGRSRTAR